MKYDTWTRYSTNLSKPLKDCGYSIWLQYCFSTRAIFFKHVSALNTYGYLSPEQIWLVHLCLHFLPICCTVYNSGFFTESGKYKWIKYCMRRNFDVKSSTVKRLKKVVHAWFYKKYTNSCQNYSVFILTDEEINLFLLQSSNTKRRSKNWAFCFFFKLFKILSKKRPGVKIFYF